MNFYGDERDKRKIYFRKTKAGNQTLVRADGTYKTIRAKGPFYEKFGGQSGEGWQRSILLEREYGIWDATAFACTLSTAIGFAFEDDQGPCVLIFISCEAAERRFYQGLSQTVILQCRQNVDAFFADPDLQKRWEGVILHPVVFKYEKGAGRPVPIRISDLGPGDFVLDACRRLGPIGSLTDLKSLDEDLFERR